eukprot:CAMPEP_0202853012 /NCGR_PEP_ID=MMETSP1389-20130828/90262_1 /ASSEMBLY_ACC=CAM_ASM_000865 /TAXON_ID=302021 /ORGANISM="Rhodomonas sp., Strain CCMP768" /LENGTH=379 /DNA_ID=CAMNT_0049531549 /DNA_START=13 /DNA_END=1152 /DNA_ORIENTATION=+
MATIAGSPEIFYIGTMDGWYLESQISDVAKGAHWVCFLVLLITTFYLAYESWTNRGPSKQSRFYAGYQEEQNLALFVNFFAMISYFGKIVSDTLDHNFSNVGPFIIGFGNYRYADYLLTCPMLVYDLLYQLRAPYRTSLSAIIFAILLSGVLAEFYALGDPRLRGGAYAWYGFGMFWFIAAYVAVMTVVRKQYERLAQLAQDTGASHSLPVLKFAVFTFSMLWVIFPLVWVVCPRGLNLIDDSATEVAHCVCDIIAKSCYGWALARFRKVYDAELYELLERLGHGEEEFERVEKDMRLSSNGDRLRRLSSESTEARAASSGWTATHPAPSLPGVVKSAPSLPGVVKSASSPPGVAVVEVRTAPEPALLNVPDCNDVEPV